MLFTIIDFVFIILVMNCLQQTIAFTILMIHCTPFLAINFNSVRLDHICDVTNFSAEDKKFWKIGRRQWKKGHFQTCVVAAFGLTDFNNLFFIFVRWVTQFMNFIIFIFETVGIFPYSSSNIAKTKSHVHSFHLKHFAMKFYSDILKKCTTIQLNSCTIN